MSIGLNLRSAAVIITVLASISSTRAAIVDLTTTGATGTIGDGKFAQVSQPPTGTGVINPFVRIKQKGNEAAYNTSGNLSQFDQHAEGGAWNKDLLLSSLQVVQYMGADHFQFILDINEKGNADSLLSLNQIQIFQTHTPGQTGGSWDDQTTGRLIQNPGGSLAALTDLHLVYDMNPGGGIANGVKLDANLNSGSGSGDMYFYLPTSLFNPAYGEYLLFYSHFGKPPGAYSSDSGFEEWAAVSAVPEPTTILAGALLLLPFCASTLRFLRR